MEERLVGTKVMCSRSEQTDSEFMGDVVLVFTDAIASGTNEYVPITYLSVVDKLGLFHTVRPRDLYKILSWGERLKDFVKKED